MDSFIREVDEEYRREQIARIWRRFGLLFVALAILALAGIGGWRYSQHAEARRAEAAAVRFEDAVQLSRDGKSDESEKALEALAADAPAGYRVLSRFRLAAERGVGEPEAGAKSYDALAQDTGIGAGLRDYARLQAASLRLGTAETEAPERELERLAVPANPWRHTARELLGLAALKRGAFDAASRWFDQIAADRETPQNLRGRLEIYTALTAGGAVRPTQ